MKKLHSMLPLAVFVLIFSLSTRQAAAQFGMGGMPDPRQITEMVVEKLRDDLVVTNEDEWNVIAPRLAKVVELKTAMSMAEMSRMMERMGVGGGFMTAMLGGAPEDPAGDNLQMMLDGDASLPEVKAALARFREAKRQKLAEMTRAQEALKSILSTRQEATLAILGLLE